MTPNEVFFGLITAAIIALVIALIWLSMKVGETLRSIRTFLETTEESLQQSLTEVNQNLKSLREVTDNVNTVAGDLRSFSTSVREVGDGVKQITFGIKQIGDTIQNLGTEVVATIHGVRAGFKTGVDVLLKNLFHQGAIR